MHRFRAEPPGLLRIEPLDELTLAYHRPAGATHLLAEPAPQVIAALQDAAASVPELLERLDLAADAAPALAERVEELVAAGLVARV